MMQPITNLPAHVAGMRATGEVTREDIDTVLLPLLNRQVARFGEIYYILVLDTPVQKFTLGAWWDDIKAGLKNFGQWKRIAIVSDQKAVEYFTNIFSFFVPGKSRGFSPNELEEAYAWISAKD